MSGLRYSSKNLEKILKEFTLGTSLYKLARDLDRSPYGIAVKINNLSEKYPNIWNPREVKEYTRDEMRKHKGDTKNQKKRWKLKERN